MSSSSSSMQGQGPLNPHAFKPVLSKSAKKKRKQQEMKLKKQLEINMNASSNSQDGQDRDQRARSRSLGADKRSTLLAPSSSSSSTSSASSDSKTSKRTVIKPAAGNPSGVDNSNLINTVAPPRRQAGLAPSELQSLMTSPRSLTTRRLLSSRRIPSRLCTATSRLTTRS